MTVKKRDHINKKIIICLLVFLSMFMLPVATTRASSNVIENNKSGIPDKNLYKTILKKLGKKTGQKFTKEEAERIKSLAVGSGRVKSKRWKSITWKHGKDQEQAGTIYPECN